MIEYSAYAYIEITEKEIISLYFLSVLNTINPRIPAYCLLQASRSLPRSTHATFKTSHLKHRYATSNGGTFWCVVKISTKFCACSVVSECLLQGCICSCCRYVTSWCVVIKFPWNSVLALLHWMDGKTGFEKLLLMLSLFNFMLHYSSR